MVTVILFGILGVVATAVIVIYKGFILSVLWGWFIVPVFGLPALPVVAAIGINLVISFLTYQPIESKSENGDAMSAIGKAINAGILYPTIILFMGWIVHLFM